MKKTLLLLLSAAFSLQGGNLLPAGGTKPHLRLPDQSAVVTRSGNTFTVESKKARGVSEFNFHRLPNIKPGKRCYVRMSFEILEFDPAFQNATSARMMFWDKNGKHLPKRNLFTPELKIEEPGQNDLLYSFMIPEDAASCSLTFWLRGVKKAQITSFILSETYPASNPDGNMLLNGTLESASMADFYFRGTSKPPVKVLERSALKAKDGRFSLRSYCSDPKQGTEINFNCLPYTPGKKYTFKADYFVSSAEGKNRVAGRVTFWDAKGKPIRYIFPEWKSVTGEWNRIDLSFFPPVNCTRVTITLWLSGKQELFLDNFYYGEAREEKLANRNAGALLISDSPDCTVWKEAPYFKVPAAGVPAGLKNGKEITLAAAANESEPFQIVVSARKEMADFSLNFSELKAAGGEVIPATAVSSRVVGFINLKNPDNPALKGLNADPILPESSAKAEKGKNLPFYVLVKVPAGAKPGIYKGKAKVLSGNKEITSFNLALRVYNFELPRIAHLKNYFYTRPFPKYNKIDGRSISAMAKNFHEIHQEHRMNGNQALVPAAPEFKIENGKLTVTSWAKFDAEIEMRHKVYDQLHFPVPMLGMMGDNWGWFRPKGEDRGKPRKSPFCKGSLISPDGLKYAGQYAALFTAHVKEKFPHLNFYAYLYDEPPARVHADLKILLDAVHKAAPDLKIFIPKDVIDEIGYVHTFCVPMSPGKIRPPRHEEHFRKGGDIWYYNWRVSMSNHDYIVSRLYPWQIYSAGGNGGLLWNTITTEEGVNPWFDMDKTFSCGGATIFYPPRTPKEKNVPSLRAAQIKEGIDDFDYLRILQHLIDKWYPGVGKVRVMEALKALIHTAPFGYKNDPHLLYALRNSIAEEIEKFKAFPATVVSTPAANSVTETAPVKFKVYAPQHTQVLINGKAAGVVSGTKVLEAACDLPALGSNQIKIELKFKGETHLFTRNFELKADERLKELDTLAAKCKSAGVNAAEITAFLAKVNSGKPYTAAERKTTGTLIEKYKQALALKQLNSPRKFVNALDKFFFERAKQVANYKQFERSEYYLDLSREAARAGSMKNYKVKVTPVLFKNHPAFELDNGIIKAVILETGAHLMSFKVQNVETLYPGLFNKVLSDEKRSARQVSKSMITQVGGYDGYGDAGAGGIWPVSFVDWDIKLKELKSNSVSLQFEVQLPDTPFLLRRTMTVKAGSPDLKMDYEIVNRMSPDRASDDPEHHQLPWRGRFVPAIGSGALPQVNDTLVVPAKFADEKLAETHFNLKKTANYERRSIRISKPYMGAFDTELQKGFVIIGDKTMSHAYVWFNSQGDHLGGGKVYTLEIPRSFYGKKYNDREPNSPLTIHPGKTFNFTLTLRGLVKVTSAEELIKQTGL